MTSLLYVSVGLDILTSPKLAFLGLGRAGNERKLKRWKFVEGLGS